MAQSTATRRPNGGEWPGGRRGRPRTPASASTSTPTAPAAVLRAEPHPRIAPKHPHLRASHVRAHATTHTTQREAKEHRDPSKIHPAQQIATLQQAFQAVPTRDEHPHEANKRPVREADASSTQIRGRAPRTHARKPDPRRRRHRSCAASRAPPCSARQASNRARTCGSASGS